MEFIEVIMVNNDLSNIPYYKLPEAYSYRMFQPGDEKFWADIEKSAGEFKTIGSAREYFCKEFDKSIDELSRRCFFMTDTNNKPIGTAMAWYNDSFQEQSYGRLHWVAIKKEYQNRGLGKALVSLAMERLTELHNQAYLTTQTTSWIAIKIYLDFSFRPFILNESHKQGWKILAEFFDHPVLEAYK